MGLFDSIVEGVAKLIGLSEQDHALRPASEAERRRTEPVVEREVEPEVEVEVEPEVEATLEAEPEVESDLGGEALPEVEVEAEAESEPIEDAFSVEEDRALSELLGRAMDAVPKVVGVAIVDLDRARVLAWEPRELSSAAAVAPMAGATREVFETAYFEAAERGLSLEQAGSAHQMLVFSDAFIHTLVRLEQYPSLALVIACQTDTNLGRLLTLVRGMRGARV